MSAFTGSKIVLTTLRANTESTKPAPKPYFIAPIAASSSLAPLSFADLNISPILIATIGDTESKVPNAIPIGPAPNKGADNVLIAA